MIYEEKLPIDHETAMVAHEFKIDPSTFALNGGEDYELLFCIRQGDYEKIRDNAEISIIGHITSITHQRDLISTSGNVVSLKAQGWDSFDKKEKE